MAIELVSKTRCFGGLQKVFKHFSSELNCSMRFSVYEPEPVPEASSNNSNNGNQTREKFNTLFYLSGRSCTEENFIQKSGFQKYANKLKLLVVGPDTWPRGTNGPGEADTWEFEEDISMYIDADREPWSKHYRMYSYVTKELTKIVEDNFPVTGKFGIFGHSMGGHGAIVMGLRNPQMFQSISALAPVSNPSNTATGRDKIFKYFLGENEREKWAQYDSTELSKSYQGPVRHILVDQGVEDELIERLLPENLKEAAATNPNIQLNLRMQEGYGHSYFFVSSFIEDHINHHAKILNALNN